MTGLRRIGKRIAIGLTDDLWLVLHLMIAGSLHWRPPGAKLGGRQNLAAFDFPDGTLTLTEAGAKRRASLHVVCRRRRPATPSIPGGIDVLAADLETFRARLIRRKSHPQARPDRPAVLSGIGNAYSDEILHAAHLSPLAQTQKLKPDEWDRLFEATADHPELLG